MRRRNLCSELLRSAADSPHARASTQDRRHASSVGFEGPGAADNQEELGCSIRKTCRLLNHDERTP